MKKPSHPSRPFPSASPRRLLSGLTPFAVLLLFAVAAPRSVSAGTYYWDSNDSAAGFGAAQGTWAAPTTNNATQGWSASSSGTDSMSGSITTTTSDSLNFGTATNQLGTGTITVSGNVSANTLAFVGSSSNITLSGGNITLGGSSPGITVTNSADSSPITETISSNVILGANQTWTVTNGGNVGLASLLVSGTVSGSGYGITKNGTGTLTLSASNTYTGATTVNAGTLRLGSSNGISSSSALTIGSASGGVFDLNGYNFTTTSLSAGNAAGTITDNSAVSGTTTFTLNGAMPAINTVLADGTNGRSLAVTLLNISNAGNVWLSSNSTFSGGLTLGGTTSQARLYYTVNATGTVGNITSSQLGRGTVTIGQTTSDKAQLFIPYSNLTVLNDIVFNSAQGTDATCAVRVGGNNIVLAGKLTAGLADINLGEGGGPGAAVLQGQLTGSNGLWLKNAYSSNLTVTLSNTTASLNNYLGNTTVDSRHTLILGAANQIPSGAGYGSMVLNGSLNLGGYSTALNAISGSGVVEAGGGTPTLTIGATGLSGTFAGTLKNATGTLSLTKSGTGTLTLSGSNTYTGATTVNAGTLTLSGSNTYTGATTVNAGTLRLGSSNGVPSYSSLVVGSASGGVFDLNGYNFTTTSLSAGNAAGTITDNSTGPGTTTFTLNGAMPALATVLADGTNGRSLAVTILNNSNSSNNLSANNTFSGGLTLGGLAC